MPADLVEIRPTVDKRPRYERAFREAVRALRGVIEARDDAIRALDDLAGAFVALDETFEQTAARPLSDILESYYGETLAIWQHIAFVKVNFDEQGDIFDGLTGFDIPELEDRYAAWLRKNGFEEADDV
jgi:hypothetical protein